MYKSDKVALTLCGLGVATILILCVRSCDEARADEPPVVNAATSYPNDHYVSGAGWYHASSGRFWPYAFNYYDAGRGYYHDGGWTPVPGVPVAASNPTYAGASEANARVASTRSSFFSGGSRGSGSSVSGTSQSSGSSSRGGFGSTGGGHGGSSS